MALLSLNCAMGWASGAATVCALYLILQVQLGAGPPAVEGLLPQPLGPDLQPAAAGGAAGGPG